MHKLMFIFITLILAFGFSSCRTEKKEDAPEVSAVSPDEAFLKEVRREYPAAEKAPDEALIGMAKEACKSLDDGYSVESIFLSIGMSDNTDMGRKIAAEAVSEGVVTYCPEHTNALIQAAQNQK